MHILVSMTIKSYGIKKITIFFRVNIEDKALDGYSGEVIQDLEIKLNCIFTLKWEFPKVHLLFYIHIHM